MQFLLLSKSLIMERTKTVNKVKADLILTADWHLRETTPVCRTDNYQKAQWRKVDEIVKIQQEEECAVVHTGDLFDHWKPSPALLSKTMLHLPDKFYTVYGNHDLPQHNLNLLHKSGIYTLEVAQKLTVLEGTHWNQIPEKASLIHMETGKKILAWHVFTYSTILPWPGCKAPKAAKLLLLFPQFDLIITGDNHKTFVEEYKGHYLVNPGSLMRMSADQEKHQPCVFLWYAKENKIIKKVLTYENGVITRDHLEQKKLRDQRIDSFISKLDSTWETAMSFEENLKHFQDTNNIKQPIMDIIYKSLEP